MDTEKPSYYAIIPANVRYDKDLRANEKLLYGELTCLASKKGYCYCSNSYLANIYGVSASAIGQWVNHLADKGYVRLEYIYEGKCIKERRIYIVEGVNKNEEVSTNIEEGVNKCLEGYQQKCEENITRSDYYERNNIGASAPTLEKASKPARKAPKKPALLDREPQNDIERVEKSYLENYMSLKKQGLMKTDMPVINWEQSRKLLKDCLGKYGLETIMDAVRKSVENDFCIRNGYSLTTILSSGVLAGLINGNDWHKGHAIDSVDHPADMGEVLF